MCVEKKHRSYITYIRKHIRSRFAYAYVSVKENWKKKLCWAIVAAAATQCSSYVFYIERLVRKLQHAYFMLCVIESRVDRSRRCFFFGIWREIFIYVYMRAHMYSKRRCGVIEICSWMFIIYDNGLHYFKMHDPWEKKTSSYK